MAENLINVPVPLTLAKSRGSPEITQNMRGSAKTSTRKCLVCAKGNPSKPRKHPSKAEKELDKTAREVQPLLKDSQYDQPLTHS